jgi:type IV secretion system protein VirB8
MGVFNRSSEVQEHPELTNYYAAGRTWEEQIAQRNRRSRGLAWTVAAITSLLALGSLGALLLALPLKSYEPYLVEVDRNTGFLEVKRALQPGAMQENEAVTMSNIVRYIRARETYDPKSLKDDFNLAQILSTGKASSDLVSLYAANNSENPTRKFGSRGSVSVNIKALSFPNSRTALVRFSTLENSGTRSVERAWQALVRFRYTSTPVTNELRFENPLGFQVTEYRRDQETVRATTSSEVATEILQPATPLVDAAKTDAAAPAVPAPITPPATDGKEIIANPPPPPIPAPAGGTNP